MVEWFPISFIIIVMLLIADTIFLILAREDRDLYGLVVFTSFAALLLIFILPAKEVSTDVTGCKYVKNEKMAIVMCGDLSTEIKDAERYMNIEQRKVVITEMKNVLNCSVGGRSLDVK